MLESGVRTAAGLALMALIAPGDGHAREALDPTGYWKTENERSIIRIAPCDRGLCGEIAWLADDENARTDSQNPDPDKRDRPICGLEMIWGLEEVSSDPGRWTDGTVYNVEDGRTYNFRLLVREPQTLEVRGYAGLPLLGRTQEWSRVDPGDFEHCDPQTQVSG